MKNKINNELKAIKKNNIIKNTIKLTSNVKLLIFNCNFVSCTFK